MMNLFLLCEDILTESNSILRQSYKYGMVEYSTSGSASQRINGTIQLTKPEYAFDQVEKKYDWCSNCGRHSKDLPWITFSIKNSKMHINGYFLKAGCCGDKDVTECCCIDETYYCCFCCLYSWSLQISNDNITWKTVHKVEKDYDMKIGKEKVYKFSEAHTAKYVRLIQDEACPGEPPCIALNKIELIGTIDGNPYVDDLSDQFGSDEDDVSIIGHIAKNKV
ncbi:hypothetical protein TVAG_421100 [Trichomonas vaginalis G3]|uniref:F5/8 type C domain-containing protein n=1 Tax=Trichomonas vaginalis (strain ATCC PRA-98 / G3) TaxID=412133 RepID=A2EVT5_TRIV3|nr:hypothetical protein TVAGG3_0204240 [Trichomonas vaginalis G3]EAY03222.1 hypothetical protein TVAG_421100 [Trichomonas vaginalis G3]KAI5550820.1 hypothetical protein TVAGG3_0204240 [Trichomonas vaginalis G3]|eukprot:XP_001315445.1 hypothetical protein [Trichomonas vaginalis G3]